MALSSRLLIKRKVRGKASFYQDGRLQPALVHIMAKRRDRCHHVGTALLELCCSVVSQVWILATSISFMVMHEGAPYTMARLIERRFVPTIYSGDLDGVFFSTPVCFNQLT